MSNKIVKAIKRSCINVVGFNAEGKAIYSLDERLYKWRKERYKALPKNLKNKFNLELQKYGSHNRNVGTVKDNGAELERRNSIIT